MKSFNMLDPCLLEFNIFVGIQPNGVFLGSQRFFPYTTSLKRRLLKVRPVFPVAW